MASFQMYFGNKSSELLDRAPSGTHWFPHFSKEDYTVVSAHLSKGDSFTLKAYQRDNGESFMVIESEERTNTGGYRQLQLFADHYTLDALKALHATIGEAIGKLDALNGGE